MCDAQAFGGVQVTVRLVQTAAVRKPRVILVPAHLPGREGALFENVERLGTSSIGSMEGC